MSLAAGRRPADPLGFPSPHVTRCLCLLGSSSGALLPSYTWMSLVCVIPETHPGPGRPLRENFPAGLVLLAGSPLITPLHHKTQRKGLPWLVKPGSTRLIWPLISMLANERVKPPSREPRGAHFTQRLGLGSRSGCQTRPAQGTPAETDQSPMTPSPPPLLG